MDEKSPLLRVLAWLFDNFSQIAVLLVGTYVIWEFNKGAIIGDKLTVWLMALVELMAISGLIERNRKLGGIEKKISDLQNLQRIPGLNHVYEDRTQFPPITQDLQATRREFFVVGLGLVSLTLTYLDVLKDKATQGCKLRILLICPGHKGRLNPIIQLVSENLDFDPDDYAKSIDGSLARLFKMRASLPKDKQKNVEIRVFDCVPTFGLIAFDGNSRSGKARLDIIPFRISRSLWPAFEFKFDERSKLYEFFYQSANQLWVSNSSHNYVPAEHFYKPVDVSGPITSPPAN